METSKKVDYSKLNPHIPKEAIAYIEEWLEPYWFHLVIKKPRSTKLGDYRVPQEGNPHIITVNSGMLKSLCFLTLTHEIAHLRTFDLYSRRIQPHGKEWKKTFSEMISESIDVYEEELKVILKVFMQNPKASFYADKKLSEYFIRKQDPNALLLKDLHVNALFKINNKFFYKLKKSKTRYICIEKNTGKRYLIAENAPVTEINVL